ncbi:MAG: ABC transporter permease subunit, partial [Aggregatilineales bacterium]
MQQDLNVTFKLNLKNIVSKHLPWASQPRGGAAAIVFAALTLAFLAMAVQFNLVGNLQILAIIIAPIGIVAVGQTLVVLLGGLDLSVGSMVALISVITAMIAASTNAGPLSSLSPWLAVVVGLAAATGIGWLHGKLISHFHLAPFIVTFGSLSLLRGLAQVISNGAPIAPQNDTFSYLWVNVFNLVPLPVIIMLMVFVAGAFVLRRTRFGRHIYAIGSNENVARLSGINVARTQQLVYALSGFLAGLSGILLMARIEAGTFNSGQDYELLSIAAVIIGGTSLKGGTGGLWGTLAGVLLMSLVNNSLFLLNVPATWNGIVTGAIIVVAALIDIQRRKMPDSWTVLRPLPIPAPPPPQPANLEQALKWLSQAITERFRDTEVRVYLLERSSGQLVDPVKHTESCGSLSATVCETSRSIAISDVSREPITRTKLFQPSHRAAAAVPITLENRIVGVIEAQSPTIGTFGEAELRILENLSAQTARIVGDRWLLESGWLTEQVRRALRHLSNNVYLSECELSEWLCLNGVNNRSEALHKLLTDAIERLSDDQGDPHSRQHRCYQILKQTYTDQKPAELVINDLGLSRRQYFYDLKYAVDAVTHYVYAQRNSPHPPTPSPIACSRTDSFGARGGTVREIEERTGNVKGLLEEMV